MEKISKKITWTFWEKIIELDIYQVKWNKNLILNIHWVYSSKDDILHKNFAEKISKNNLANIVLFSSSRKNLPETWEKTDKFRNFIWKSFSEELEDSEIVLKNILENSLKYFWTEKENLNIFLNWNSLWWTIAFFLAYKFPFLKNISTVWTWLRKQKWETPIIDSFPIFEEYQKILKNFSGKYLMHEWTKDEKFSHESFSELFENIQTKDKKRIIYDWVNHPFSKIFWETSEKPYNEVFENFVKYFWLK